MYLMWHFLSVVQEKVKIKYLLGCSDDDKRLKFISVAMYRRWPLSCCHEEPDTSFAGGGGPWTD